MTKKLNNELKTETANIINLTRHSVTILPLGEVIEPSSEYPTVSVDIKKSVDKKINNIEIIVAETVKVVNLPPIVEGTYYIVSSPVANAMRGLREDLLSPDEVVKDGKIVLGCKRLKQWK